MKICKEMIKLRKGLDERGIVWIDASETYGNDKIKALGIDFTIHRTHFTAYGVWFSVIYGHGTYGKESGLLECMSKAVDERGVPKGSMTADEILEVIKEIQTEQVNNEENVESKNEIENTNRYECQICGALFELNKANRYVIVEDEAPLTAMFSVLATYECFDCPKCGCQNRVNERKGGYIIDEQTKIDTDEHL